MKKVITIRYYNENTPNDHTVLVRQLVPSLQSFQRSLDKLSIYTHEGRILKNSKLSHERQFETDLYVSAFVEGSFEVPLLGVLGSKIKKTYVDFMKEPYEKAAAEFSEELHLTLGERVAVLKQLEGEGGLDLISEEMLADGTPGFNRSDAQGKFLRDMNKAVYPVTREDGQAVDIAIYDGAETFKYTFDKRIAKRFNSIVERTMVEEPVICYGSIDGLGRKSNTGPYRYYAKYTSASTGQERNLYILNDEDANKLKSFNLENDFSFLASPVSRNGAYDTMRGDLIFIRLY
ncbi:hypothetical protein QEN58_15835 [Halomonas alkaliantarctica]|uniref:Uncharacterized protein n=1 Tax=Halomonas alkaliantarctica TaxID=232346 RepID=A0ABY8LMI4_9GAMM|nr:hypothetical protein [Halomonas alkaliantarctica]WGI24787.1 hypothetical protein QEN58_15835 [Halomonas alkaliantarctica]